ncbi:FAD-dependent oxidoreductase [Rhodovulum sp. ES.010]|nr:FAD-dependent oxidoreductase [Rhodovulum sp. ES.010]
MGTCSALFLARHGARVTLFEQMAASMEGASRLNEGKVHRGY